MRRVTPTCGPDGTGIQAGSFCGKLTLFQQSHFVAQCGTQSGERTDRIVLATVEAAVNTLLNATAQWLEESSNGKSGGHNRQVVSSGETAQEKLQADDATGIQQDQRHAQRAVNERTVDQNIDVPEPGAQDGNGEKEWEAQQEDVNKRIAQH